VLRDGARPARAAVLGVSSPTLDSPDELELSDKLEMSELSAKEGGSSSDFRKSKTWSKKTGRVHLGVLTARWLVARGWRQQHELRGTRHGKCSCERHTACEGRAPAGRGCRLPQHRDGRSLGPAQRGQWQSRARDSPSPCRGQLPCRPLPLPHIESPAVGLGVRGHMLPHHHSLCRGDRCAGGEVLSLAEREAHRRNRQSAAQGTLHFPLGAGRKGRWLRGESKGKVRLFMSRFVGKRKGLIKMRF
jgi:hypothetical protein